jgi:hypothetical protein
MSTDETIYFRGQDRAKYDYMQPVDVARFKRLDAIDNAQTMRFATGQTACCGAKKGHACKCEVKPVDKARPFDPSTLRYA